jgi:hypothetical protein
MYEDYAMLERNDPDSVGGLSEVYYGMFTEPDHGHMPRAKALELQKIFGGTGDLTMHRSWQS